MPAAKSLLQLLRCPSTDQRLDDADPATLAKINALISSGNAVTSSGAPVTAPWSGALVRSDRKLAYPVRDGIPVVVRGEALSPETTPPPPCA